MCISFFVISGCYTKNKDDDFDRNIAKLIQDGVRMAEIIVLDDLTSENSFVEYDEKGNVVNVYFIRKVKFPRLQDLDFSSSFDTDIKVFEKAGVDDKSNEVISFLPDGVDHLKKGDHYIIFFTTETINGQDVMLIEGDGLYRIPAEYNDHLNIGRVLLKYYSNATEEQINSIREINVPCVLPTGEFTNGWYYYYENSDTTVFELLEPIFHASVKGKIKFNTHIKY